MNEFCINSLCPSCDKCVYLLDCYPDYYHQCPTDDDDWADEDDDEEEQQQNENNQ